MYILHPSFPLSLRENPELVIQILQGVRRGITLHGVIGWLSQLPTHLWLDHDHLMPSVGELLHDRAHGEPVAPVHGDDQQLARLGAAGCQQEAQAQREARPRRGSHWVAQPRAAGRRIPSSSDSAGRGGTGTKPAAREGVYS